MKRLFFVLGATLWIALSCGKKAVETAAGTTGATGPALELSWAAQSGVTAYHVYYVIAAKKAVEIDSLQADSPDFAKPKLMVSHSNMETWPAKGSKACFYVVADNGGIVSLPSAQTCIVM